MQVIKIILILVTFFSFALWAARKSRRMRERPSSLLPNDQEKEGKEKEERQKKLIHSSYRNIIALALVVLIISDINDILNSGSLDLPRSMLFFVIFIIYGGLLYNKTKRKLTEKAQQEGRPVWIIFVKEYFLELRKDSEKVVFQELKGIEATFATIIIVAGLIFLMAFIGGLAWMVLHQIPAVSDYALIIVVSVEGLLIILFIIIYKGKKRSKS